MQTIDTPSPETLDKSFPARSLPPFTPIEPVQEYYWVEPIYRPPPSGWYRDPQHVSRALYFLGITAPPDTPFDCILPGAPPGAQARIDGERLTYTTDTGDWMHLAEVHASITSRRRQSLSRRNEADAPAMDTAHALDRLARGRSWTSRRRR